MWCERVPIAVDLHEIVLAPPHLAQHLVHTCSHLVHTWFTLTWHSTAVQCGLWIYMKLATAASLLSFFSPSPCFLSSYLDCSYFTFSTRWIVDLHETALPTRPPPYPHHLSTYHLFNTFEWNQRTSQTPNVSTDLSIWMVRRNSVQITTKLTEFWIKVGCNFLVDNLGEDQVI